MFFDLERPIGGRFRRFLVSISLLALALGAFALLPPLFAQDTPSGQQKSTEPPPEAGGPGNEVGPYAIPKKKEEPPPPPPEKPKKIENMPDYSIQVDVPLVNLDVLVTTKDGQFISNLKKENFRVYEDGTPQTISNFNTSEAPITAVLLVEFASTNYSFMIDALRASYTFASMLKKDDWVAVVSYDMKPDMLVDFTQDKSAIMGAINQLRMPGFAETNLFDALYDTLDRLDRVEGHKYIILVSTGFDSFSQLNLDQIMKKVKTTHDVTIFPISIGWLLREYCETHGCTGYSHGNGIPITRNGLPAGRQRNANFRPVDRRTVLSAALRSRVPGSLSAHRRRYPQSVQPGLSSHQSQARWQLS